MTETAEFHVDQDVVAAERPPRKGEGDEVIATRQAGHPGGGGASLRPCCAVGRHLELDSFNDSFELNRVPQSGLVPNRDKRFALPATSSPPSTDTSPVVHIDIVRCYIASLRPGQRASRLRGVAPKHPDPPPTPHRRQRHEDS